MSHFIVSRFNYIPGSFLRDTGSIIDRGIPED